MSNKQKDEIMTIRLFVNKATLKASVVKTYGRGFSQVRKETEFSIAKGVNAYGFENEVNHLAEVYNAQETIVK